MTPDNPGPGEPSNDLSETPADESRGVLRRIRAVIEAISAIEQHENGHRRASGRVDRGTLRVDYEYDLSVGLDDRLEPPERSDADGPRSDRDSDGRASDSTPIHVQKSVGDDELVVAVDLPDVTDDRFAVTLDADKPALELTVEGELIDRIGIDHPGMAISDTSLTNRILEVTLVREDADGENASDNEGNSDE